MTDTAALIRLRIMALETPPRSARKDFAIEELRFVLDRLTPPPVATATVVDAGECWKHVKRGTEYAVIGVALLQDAAGHGVHEGIPLTIYRGDDGMMWARATNEFHDGRFIRTKQPEGGR